jgi:hypothetical protein
MSAAELVRVRLHEGTAHTGKITRLLANGPARDGTPLTIELDTGATAHLADVASIGPPNRHARRSDRRDPRLAACAHTFGYRGHCLTKSLRYSTTFKQLRADREAYVHAQIIDRSRDATQRALTAAELRLATFEYVGVGHVTAADAYLAASAAARAREQRRIGREERAWALAHGSDVDRDCWSGGGRGGGCPEGGVEIGGDAGV